MADYIIDTSHDAYNFTPANQISQVPGFAQYAPREVLFGTVHYWGDPAPTFEEVISFFCDGPGKGTSAHCVLEAGRVFWIVSPDDISWACGNAYGNVKSISMECNPRASDADYQTAAEEWARLWGIYGKFPLVPHNHWTATNCPGPWDVARLEQMATDIFNGVTPTPTEDDMPYLNWPQEDKDALVNDIFGKKFVRQGVDPKGYANPNVDLEAVVSWFDAAHVATRNVVTAAISAAEEAILAKVTGSTGGGTTSAALSDQDKQDIADKVVAEVKTQWTK